MVALSAKRLVCEAMSLISLTTSPIRPEASASSLTVPSVWRASSAAAAAMRVDWATWRPISVMEALNSSAAVATVCTLAEACSVAEATVTA